MKYVILVGDGMGDYPVDSLSGRTPLEAAKTPNMDWIVEHGEVGRAKTIPDGCEAGSDTANLSILGYDPAGVLTGRGPLEAASLGIELSSADVAYRCNLVTLSGQEPDVVMEDYSAGHVSTDEARTLILDLDRGVGNDTFQFYPGVSYRHIMVWRDGEMDVNTTPPHDITGRAVGPYLDRMGSSEPLLELMHNAASLLKDHPVNRRRMKMGEKPANNVWFWGQGNPLRITPFKEKTGLSGAMISAVDLLKGIGVYAGLDVINVPGATGYLDTNYAGKVKGCLRALQEVDFVYLHVEAPDEASHSGLLDEKIEAIEAFDEKIVGSVIHGLKAVGDFRIMVLPDHYTPVSVRTHTREPAPFAIFGTDREKTGTNRGFNEKTAEKGPLVEEGFRLIHRLID
ncbi:MAG: cofactor-independent phosphoglycerate mutase [Desulfobacterales bacterium]|jgi:2,3-bisphosphoglycerate-independent phosphoglycerate mutase|nr:cofactor-independent phosphoglycerate mutase [Desulfobacterales bacterium]